MVYYLSMTQVFFLTGSSRGLGRQIAEAVLAAGHRLVATARQPASLADLAERYGDRILPVALDVTEVAAAQAAVAAGVAAFGRIDVVVNNAGYANLAAIEDITPQDFREQLDANLLGVVNVTQAALPVLRAQGGGRIIQVSSIGGRLATPGLGGGGGGIRRPSGRSAASPRCSRARPPRSASRSRSSSRAACRPTGPAPR
jgi:NAD(P)-dependent dehydrogenase (short-subunit alcohol dehydrogenase family)